MPRNRKTDGETWQALAALGDDLLDPSYPEAAIDAELAELGIDAVALAKRGSEIAEALREQERLSWQRRARVRADRMKDIAARVQAPASLERAAILQRLEELRVGPPGQTIAAAFRKRRAEESTDAELRALLEDMEALRAISEDEGES